MKTFPEYPANVSKAESSFPTRRPPSWIQAEVNLAPLLKAVRPTLQVQANALVFSFAHGIDCQGGRIEDDAFVGSFDLANPGEEVVNGAGVRVALAEQVKIAGWPEDVFGPGHEQHCALEYIALGRFGHTEAEKQAFDRIPRQDALIVVTLLPRVLKKAVSY
ncbi:MULTISPECIES: hypothetical protein [Mesorhizobium]|uniref:hypothetical protein n=1 Tax=unclassified Mesorhizobium TaxID=325217 RepID=UPI0007ED583C|nr:MULTISPECIES: hypothetical protein [Mesorhizobium]